MQILMIGDPNLGPAGQNLLEEFVPKLDTLIWQKGDKNGKLQCQKFIRSRRWKLIILFYCDLILEIEDINCADLIINIHPASPEFPGVGYDVMPLLKKRKLHEATMHFVKDENVDKGTIIEVVSQPLSPETDYTELREANQELCLFQLMGLAQRIQRYPSLNSLDAALRAESKRCDRKWGREYYNQKEINKRLLKLWESGETNHPVFQGNKRFQGYLEGLKGACTL